MAKILVLGSHAESLIVFRFDMLKALAEHHTVIACVPEVNSTIIEKLRSINIECIEIKMNRTGLNPISDLRMVYELYKTFKKVQPDKLFSYTGKPVIYGSIAAKLARIPKIYSMITGLGSYFIHSDPKSKLIRLVMSLLYRLSLGFNDQVFFQNPDDIADFASHKIFKDPSRTVLINGSGVNLEHFSQLALPDTSIRFLMTARFIVAKGVMEYLEAAKMIKIKYPHVEFLLVGWFENKDESIQPRTIQDYIDQGIIQYLGKLSDVRPALAQASVFVLPSYREGTPKTVLEAMACGRPIITTDVPGCRETVVNGDNGFLVPAQDIKALQIAMEQFILQPELILSMGARCREIAVTKYNVNGVNQAIIDAMEARIASPSATSSTIHPEFNTTN